MITKQLVSVTGPFKTVRGYEVRFRYCGQEAQVREFPHDDEWLYRQYGSPLQAAQEFAEKLHNEKNSHVR